MEKLEIVLELRNEVEARLLESLLKERDIPHVIKSYHDSAYDGLWQQQLGWGHVDAPQRFKDEIHEIYESLSPGDDE